MEQKSLVLCEDYSPKNLRFLLHTINDYKDKDINLLVLNLTETSHLNSESIGLLVDIQMSLSDFGIALVLSNPSEFQARLIRLTQARDYLVVYDTHEEAVADPKAYQLIEVPS